jgi:hypothetical protein
MWAEVSFKKLLRQLIPTCAFGCTFLGYFAYLVLDWYYYKLPNTPPPEKPDFPNPYVSLAIWGDNRIVSGRTHACSKRTAQAAQTVL